MTKFYKLIIAIFVFCAFLQANIYSQVINVPSVIQEQTQWCWAASSACVLDFYGDITAQCTIAEYTREVSTSCNSNNYGTTNCCSNATLGCNQWNYNWGCPGSIQDILTHFGFIETNSISDSLSLPAIQTEITAGRPFIFRWGWSTGGGHFLVGYGISGNNMYYMDPLVGEGYEINNYHWVTSGTNSEGTHTWTHTQTIANAGIADFSQLQQVILFPNPASTELSIEVPQQAVIEISDVQGRLISTFLITENKTNFNISDFAEGVYILKAKTEKGIAIKKFIKE
jgi:hypothetical protein